MKAHVDLQEIGKAAKQAAHIMAFASTEQKNRALENIANAINQHQAKVMSANAEDIHKAVKASLPTEMLDRLSLQGRLQGIVRDVLKIRELPDPIGEMFERKVLPNGLQVEKWRTSLGVIGVIYESRPNVTVDAASLSIKTGNAIILRGGSETLNTNRVLVEMIRKALKSASLPENAVQWIDSSDRGLVKQLLHLHDFIDLIIPRGGARLHQFCRENSTIPVITGGIGICHLFVDKSADLEAALPLIYNAKVQHPTACNALDTLLVHREIANEFLPRVSKTLEAAGVVLRTDGEAWKILHGEHLVEKAREESDWDTEWLSLNLGIKIVKGLKEAVEHIQKHSRGHSDGILTQDPEQAKKFVQQVDSAAVYVNASTRFTDGGQLGLGAEIAISTQKFHARGPMGLNELTSYKWVIQGNYHVRQ